MISWRYHAGMRYHQAGKPLSLVMRHLYYSGAGTFVPDSILRSDVDGICSAIRIVSISFRNQRDCE